MNSQHQRSDQNEEDVDVMGGGDPSLEQFLILAEKVEELEDRIRSMAESDIASLSERIDAQQTAIRNLKSPGYWLGGAWRKTRRALRSG